MWYNLFRFPSDPKIIGVIEGVSQVEIDEQKYTNADSYKIIETFFSYQNYWDNWNAEKFFPDFDVEIHANLVKGAILTDFMRCAPHFMSCHFLIHDNVAEVFSKFKFPPYQLYNVTLYKNGKIASNSYKLFCCPFMAYENIVDFEKSVFFTGPLTRKKYHKLKNWEEYKSFPDSLNVEILSMSSNFDNTLDFYSGRIGGIQFSQPLTEALEQKGFTGIRLLDKSHPQLRVL